MRTNDVEASGKRDYDISIIKPQMRVEDIQKRGAGMAQSG